MRRKIFVVLPVYNEADNLSDLLAKIDASCLAYLVDYRVIAVDDGSIDGSRDLLAQMAEKYPIEILRHRINRGLGETIRDGFERAVELADDSDLIVRMDSDNTHDPKYISAMIQAIDQGADIAVASRFAEGGGQIGVPSDRKWISVCANLYFRFFFPIRGLREYTCGYRMYRVSIVRDGLQAFGNSLLQLKGFGFCCTLEKLLKFHLLGADVREVPFVLRYDLKKGQSKMVFNITTLGYLIMVPLYWWPWGGWRFLVGQLSRSKALG